MIEDGATGRTWISLGGSGKSWSVPDCFLLASPASAQRAGDILIEAGWLHGIPQEGNGAPRNTLRPNPLFPLLGVQSEFRSEGIDIDADHLNTFALVGQYFLTADWSVRLVVGYPPKGSIDGSGTVQATGPLGNALRIGNPPAG